LLIKQTATPKTSDTDCRDRKTRQEQKNIKPLELSFFHILAISSHMASQLSLAKRRDRWYHCPGIRRRSRFL